MGGGHHCTASLERGLLPVISGGYQTLELLLEGLLRAGAETGKGCLRNERHYEDYFTAARVADANVGHGGLHGVKAAGETLHDEFWGSSRGTEGLLGMHSAMDASSMPLNCVMSQ